MSLLPLLVLIGISLAIGTLARGRWRLWTLMVTSILAIYWLQPGIPIHHLDFWLPTSSLILLTLVWSVTLPNKSNYLRINLVTGLVMIAVILLIGATRYLGNFCCLTPTRPPALPLILPVILLILLIVIIFTSFSIGRVERIYGFIFLILAIFVVLKIEPLTRLASMGLRSVSGQSVELATALDIRWIGFSYLAFRLLHTLIDRLNGRLPTLNLQEYVIYTIFYPALSAGPIDRVQRFIQNIHQPYHSSFDDLLFGGKRILIGIFNKFVLADSLALFALNNINATQVNSPWWLWFMLYAFAFRIYFDFSGYTDIAIGMGNLVGIQLPENFEKPYQKQNLTLFWNSWHMTLATWFRAYFFNPMTRKIRLQSQSLPLPLIIFVGQLSTFILIGLWHGITWNFAIWGAWHGFGLFIHNRWTELLRSNRILLDNRPRLKILVNSVSTLLTFHYVSLGWVWFALSSVDQSWNTFLKLFGFI